MESKIISSVKVFLCGSIYIFVQQTSFIYLFLRSLVSCTKLCPSLGQARRPQSHQKVPWMLPKLSYSEDYQMWSAQLQVSKYLFMAVIVLLVSVNASISLNSKTGVLGISMFLTIFSGSPLQNLLAQVHLNNAICFGSLFMPSDDLARRNRFNIQLFSPWYIYHSDY